MIGQDPAGGHEGRRGLDRHPDGLERARHGAGPVGRRAVAQRRASAAHATPASTSRSARGLRHGPEGDAIGTSPPAGTQLDKGSTVSRCRLERARAGRRCPTSSASSSTTRQRDAERRAASRSSVNEQEDDDEDPGTVLAQDPAGGRRSTRARGHARRSPRQPSEVDVPDVTGETEDDAIDRAVEAPASRSSTVEHAASTAGRRRRRARRRTRPAARPKRGSTVTIDRRATSTPDATPDRRRRRRRTPTTATDHADDP